MRRLPNIEQHQRFRVCSDFNELIYLSKALYGTQSMRDVCRELSLKLCYMVYMEKVTGVLTYLTQQLLLTLPNYATNITINNKYNFNKYTPLSLNTM